MRTLKLSVVCLLFVATSLPLCQKFFPGFLVLGQSVSSITAPVDVVASDNSYSTKVGLTWDPVRGATLYRIFRNTTNDPPTAAVVGTTVEASFVNASAIAGQTYFFWGRGDNGNAT